MKRTRKTKSKAKALPLLVEPDDYEPPCASCCQHGCSGCSSKPPKSPHVRRSVTTSRVPSGAESTRKGKESKRRAGKSLRRSAAAASL